MPTTATRQTKNCAIPISQDDCSGYAALPSAPRIGLPALPSDGPQFHAQVHDSRAKSTVRQDLFGDFAVSVDMGPFAHKICRALVALETQFIPEKRTHF